MKGFRLPSAAPASFPRRSAPRLVAEDGRKVSGALEVLRKWLEKHHPLAGQGLVILMGFTRCLSV